MMVLETICSECGGVVTRGERCQDCGHDPSEDAGVDVWLEVGDHFKLALEPGALGLRSERGAALHLELEMVELWEHYEHRRVLLAHLSGWTCGDISPNDAQFSEKLADLSLVVEQEVEDILGARQVVPEALKQ